MAEQHGRVPAENIPRADRAAILPGSDQALARFRLMHGELRTPPALATHSSGRSVGGTRLCAEARTIAPDGERRESERMRTVYHEAAHAILVHGLGGFVTNVDGVGETSYAWPPEPVGRAQVTERMRDMVRMVVLYGGPIAEDLLGRPGERPGTVAMVQACRTLPHLQGGPDRDLHHDFDRIAGIARERFGSNRDSVFGYLITAARLAEDLVRTHWEAIERIAQHALRLGSVGGPLFRSLVVSQLGRGDLRQALEAARF